jgi:small-conductance mechanosensitive channel
MQSVIEFLSSPHFQLAWVPDWATSAVLIAIFILLAWWLHALVFRVIARIGGKWDLFWRSLVSRTESPSRFAAIMLAVALAVTIAPLSEAQATAVRQAMIVGIVVLTGWSLIIALHIWLVLHLRRYKLDIEDNLLARKHVTQSRILERIARTLIVVLTLGAALMTFDDVRQYGVGLLASAGAVSLVIGFALQPMLKNLVAGVQLAITQPIRIDDALLVNDEWGHVEEITSTYVVIQLWDWRRMIVPLSHFIEQPFQNWTRESAALIGSVFLYVDFTVPVGDLRKKLEQIAHASPLWDGRVAALQVTDFKESTMEIRMLVSASSASRAFDLRCEVREKMIAYVQQRFPDALPRLRADLRDQRELAVAKMMAE